MSIRLLILEMECIPAAPLPCTEIALSRCVLKVFTNMYFLHDLVGQSGHVIKNIIAIGTVLNSCILTPPPNSTDSNYINMVARYWNLTKSSSCAITIHANCDHYQLRITIHNSKSDEHI